MMSCPTKRIEQTVEYLRSRTEFAPEAGIVLGSGLGGLVDQIDLAAVIDYAEIPEFPVSTVAGHKGRLIFGTLGGRRVVAMQGRFHYYEGYAPAEAVFPIRVLQRLGIRTLFLSNASGGINPDFRTGDLMVITDHINLIPNPLVGPNPDELGPRFVDMHDAYDPGLIALADEIGRREEIALQHGVYVGRSGPTYETQAEYRYYRIIGGDTVGMSTTPEVIAARHMGLPVFAVSIITNQGIGTAPANHEEVQAEGARAEKKMTRLFTEMLKALPL